MSLGFGHGVSNGFGNGFGHGVGRDVGLRVMTSVGYYLAVSYLANDL